MGRILRLALTEDVPERIDLGMIRPGKILIKNSHMYTGRTGWFEQKAGHMIMSNLFTSSAADRS